MQLHQLAADIFVTGQISPNDLTAFAAKGIRTVVNNRPDHEGFGQPTSAEMAAAAEALGMKYVYFPVLSGGITRENVEGFAKIRPELEGPVLLYCRSGARSTRLWELSFAIQPDNTARLR
jgi:sulfide:quinone oxidoreductase